MHTTVIITRIRYRARFKNKEPKLQESEKLLALLSAAREKGEFLLVHGQTKQGELATMTLGRCFQSEPEIVLLGFEDKVAKAQLREILQVFSQLFEIPSQLKDESGATLSCSSVALKDWFQSDLSVAEAVSALTQAIPLERMKDFLEMAQVCVVSSSKN